MYTFSNLSINEPQDGYIIAFILQMENQDLEVSLLNVLSSAFTVRISWFETISIPNNISSPKKGKS